MQPGKKHTHTHQGLWNTAVSHIMLWLRNPDFLTAGSYMTHMNVTTLNDWCYFVRFQQGKNDGASLCLQQIRCLFVCRFQIQYKHNVCAQLQMKISLYLMLQRLEMSEATEKWSPLELLFRSNSQSVVCNKNDGCSPILGFRWDSAYLGWFEGVVCRKMNCQEENSSLIWTVSLKARTAFPYLKREWSTTSCPQRHSINSNFSRNQENTFKAARDAAAVTNLNMAPPSGRRGATRDVKHWLTGPMIVACQWNTAGNRKWMLDNGKVHGHANRHY